MSVRFSSLIIIVVELPAAPVHILLVEDNLAHQKLSEHALRRSAIPVKYFVVRDGQEALDYLFRKPPFEDPDKYPTPQLILLDLNIPKRDGREVLKIIKSDAGLMEIPVVIVSTSDREEDVNFAFSTGATAYISKSSGFDKFTAELSAVAQYARAL